MKKRRFKKGAKVIKLPLEDKTQAQIIKVLSSTPEVAYCSDGNKYSQKTGKRLGRTVFNKKV